MVSKKAFNSRKHDKLSSLIQIQLTKFNMLNNHYLLERKKKSWLIILLLLSLLGRAEVEVIKPEIQVRVKIEQPTMPIQKLLGEMLEIF